MLKPAVLPKDENFETQAADAVRELLERLPFAQAVRVEQGMRPAGGRRPDLVARVKVGGQAWTLVAECKRDGQPRQVRAAALQVADYLARMPDKAKYGLVVAPFISEKSSEVCREAGVGFLDLAGNCRISFDRIFIETRTADNPFRVRRELRSVLSPKALRVLRVMLTGRIRPWKVTELAETTGVSLGQVSNVRKQLLEREWAAVRADGVELTQPAEILRTWQAERPRERGRVEELFTLDRPADFEGTLAAACERLGVRSALTELAGAARLAPMARYVRTRAYVEQLDRVAEDLKLKPVETGANVVLVQPADDGVFYGLRRLGGVPVACPVQVYADLATGGARREEAAEALLRQVIEPEWQIEA